MRALAERRELRHGHHRGFAAATPVLASDIPGYRDVLRDGVDGQLVPAGDALALARGAAAARARTANRRERMALAARERAERFAWPHVAAEVLDCYEQALAVGAPATRLGARRRPSRLRPGRSAAARASPAAAIAAGDGAAAARLRPRRGARVRCAALGLPASSLAGGGARGAGAAARRRRRVSPPRCLPPSPACWSPGWRLMCAAMFVARARLARDPRRRPDLATRQTSRRDAGHVHRRADVGDAAGTPGRALACADRRAPSRARARDPAGRARHDGLPDAAQPARAADSRLRHAVERERARRPRPPAAADRARPARRAARGAARAGADTARGRLALAARAGAARRAAPACCCVCATACACFAGRARGLATAAQLGAWALQLAVLLAVADGARPGLARRASPLPRASCSRSTSRR